MTKIACLLIPLIFVYTVCLSQLTPDTPPTLQDTLRGSITAERAWWDAVKYDITVEPDFDTKTISGSNTITFNTLKSGSRMQIDLQVPMEITSVSIDYKKPAFTRNGNVYYIEFDDEIKEGLTKSINITFSGKPREATNPPWDGGWIWKRDANSNPWMSVACEGLGASVWYPCKDHQSDEPDSASLTMIVPPGLKGVANGKLRSVKKQHDKYAYTWAVVNPINNYNIIPSIGKYASWTETFEGEKGTLDLSYWVLEEHVDKARKQFMQVPKMLKCFEEWFGPYPFYEDGYKLIESPHLGMEHQSGIAYGNRFQNGYLGKDLSGTGWGKKWDFIIIHESGHEWFGNNITVKDLADLWVHEGFTNYSEVIYTGCEYGVQAGNEYLQGLRKNIQNDRPAIAPYGVNREGSVDIYAKGANLVHTIRQIMNDDEKFRLMLREMNTTYFHQTVTSKEIEKFISEKTGTDLSKVFDQYLRTTNIPRFEYFTKGGKLHYRWGNCVDGFNMPLRVTAGKTYVLKPTTSWQEMNIESSANTHVTVDPNFYVGSARVRF